MGYVRGLKKIGEYYHYRYKRDGQLLRGSTKCKTLPDAQKWLTQYRAKIVMEGVGIREMRNLKELLVEWVKTAAGSNQDGEIKRMKSAIATHFSTLLTLPIDQITTERVQTARLAYLKSKGNGPGRKAHTGGGANALVSRLDTLFGYAMRCGYINRKPYDVIPIQNQQQPRPVVRAAKTQTFLEKMEGIRSSPDQRLAVSLMLGLGLRESEALGIRWEFLDFEHNSVVVGRIENDQFQTKGGEARRLELPRWLADRLKDRCKASKNPKKGLILPGPDANTSHSPGFTRKLVQKIGKACGLEGLTPHRLRASFASALSLEAGIPLGEVQMMLGHKHIQTTLKYVEEAESHKAAQKKLERLQGFGRVPKKENIKKRNNTKSNQNSI